MSPLRLLHVTDLHLSGDEAAVLRGIQPLETLRRTLAQAIAHTQASGWPPDAIVVTGDVVHDDPRGYQLFRREFASLGVPVCLHHHPVPMSSDWLDQIGLSNAAEFWSIVDAHRNVRAVLWGHVHQSF